MQRIFFIICVFVSSNLLVGMHDQNRDKDVIIKTVQLNAALTKTKITTYQSGKTVQDIWKMSPIQMTDRNGNQLYPDKHERTIIQYPDDGIHNYGEKEIITYDTDEVAHSQKFDKYGNVLA